MFENTNTMFNKSLNDKRDAVKQEIITFFQESQEEILEYFNSLNDEVLLNREKDFISELRDLIEKHKNHRLA